MLRCVVWLSPADTYPATSFNLYYAHRSIIIAFVAFEFVDLDTFRATHLSNDAAKLFSNSWKYSTPGSVIWSFLCEPLFSAYLWIHSFSTVLYICLQCACLSRSFWCFVFLSRTHFWHMRHMVIVYNFLNILPFGRMRMIWSAAGCNATMHHCRFSAVFNEQAWTIYAYIWHCAHRRHASTYTVIVVGPWTAYGLLFVFVFHFILFKYSWFSWMPCGIPD